MKSILICCVSVQLAIARILPRLEEHGIPHGVVERSKEIRVSLDAEAYMNDVGHLC